MSNFRQSYATIQPPSAHMGGPAGTTTKLQYDGKRATKKAVVRRTVDYFSSVSKMIHQMRTRKHPWDYQSLQPDPSYIVDFLPPICYLRNPAMSLCSRFVHTSMNKIRCPVNVVRWTPEGKRLITGSSSGEFTLWNGLTFNFETILQAHEQSVRAMVWSHDGQFMISADHVGTIKYWQPNMNNVQMFQGHKEPIRDLSFSPTDAKFASCSDDSTIKIWDFLQAKEERTVTGHGWDVKNVQWHPYKALLASGSKDNTVKLWDPRTGRNLATIHGHKNTVLDLKWNRNGQWLLTAGKDQLIKLYDIRKIVELQSFKGHKKDVTSLAWHPHLESGFVSGSFDGALMYWNVGYSSELCTIENAHESSVWSLDFHPLGHLLTSGSNDHTTKFWCRARPGDREGDDKIGMVRPSITGTTSGHQSQQPPQQQQQQQQQTYEERYPPGRSGPSNNYGGKSKRFN